MSGVILGYVLCLVLFWVMCDVWCCFGLCVMSGVVLGYVLCLVLF